MKYSNTKNSDIHLVPEHKFVEGEPIPRVVIAHEWFGWEVLYIDGKRVSQGFPFSRFELLRLSREYNFSFEDIVRFVFSDKDQEKLMKRGFPSNDITGLDLYYGNEVG